MNSTCIIASLNGGLGRQWLGKILSVGKVLDNIPGHLLSMEKKMVNGLSSRSKPQKEKDGNTEDKELSGRGMWMGIWNENKV